MGKTVAGTGTEPPAPAAARPHRRAWVSLVLFLAPALVILGALVVYPIFFTVIRSTFDATGDRFIGVDNYREMFTSSRTLTAIKNNAIWVVFAPTLATILGLLFAVMTERVKWATAFKVAVFMPMAISLLASGVIWRLVYEREPDRGLANAATAGVVEVFRPPGQYPGARPAQPEAFSADGDAYRSLSTYRPGDTATLGLVAIPPSQVPAEARRAQPPVGAPSSISGVVWLDFTVGGGGERGVIDATENGLPGVKVEAIAPDGSVAGSAKTGSTGIFRIGGLSFNNYELRLAESNFRPAFAGVSWLGPTLVTPAVIVSFLWIWAGFAMVVIGAGLAAIPRDVLEAARVDGATEGQLFRRVTVPLLMPVLTVVLVTLAINVLKIFDLVLIIPPGSSQNSANVLALEMWRVSFGGANDQGLGSALAVFLFVLVLPAMLFNIRRFRTEA